MNPFLRTAIQTKKLTWTPFDFYGDYRFRPPSTQAGRRYLCCDIHGYMAVCIWGVSDWLIDVGDFNHDAILNSMKNDAVLAVLRKSARKLTDEQFDEWFEEAREVLYEGKESDSIYFDEVEWFMELPNPPMIDSIDANEQDIDAALFDQSSDLMAHIEASLKSYLMKPSLKQRESNDSP